MWGPWGSPLYSWLADSFLSVLPKLPKGSFYCHYRDGRLFSCTWNPLPQRTALVTLLTEEMSSPRGQWLNVRPKRGVCPLTFSETPDFLILIAESKKQVLKLQSLGNGNEECQPKTWKEMIVSVGFWLFPLEHKW